MNPWFYQQPISPTPIHTSYPPLYLFHRRQRGSKHPLNKTYNCSGPPAFKRQRARCQSNQKLMHHYEHLNNQLDSLFFLKIQQILRSHEPKGLSLPFWPGPTFNFPEFVQRWKKVHLFSFRDTVTFRVTWLDRPHPSLTMPTRSVSTCKKSVYYICSFFTCSQFYSPVTWLAIHISNYTQLKNFSLTFNFCEFLSTC